MANSDTKIKDFYNKLNAEEITLKEFVAQLNKSIDNPPTIKTLTAILTELDSKDKADLLEEILNFIRTVAKQQLNNQAIASYREFCEDFKTGNPPYAQLSRQCKKYLPKDSALKGWLLDNEDSSNREGTQVFFSKIAETIQSNTKNFPTNYELDKRSNDSYDALVGILFLTSLAVAYQLRSNMQEFDSLQRTGTEKLSFGKFVETKSADSSNPFQHIISFFANSSVTNSLYSGTKGLYSMLPNFNVSSYLFGNQETTDSNDHQRNCRSPRCNM